MSHKKNQKFCMYLKPSSGVFYLIILGVSFLKSTILKVNMFSEYNMHNTQSGVVWIKSMVQNKV